MKPRPRAAENGIAREINNIFIPLGFSEVKRIPVLGREGPDLTINETGLVIDVKSRKQCPSKFFSRENYLQTQGNIPICAVSIENLPNLQNLTQVETFGSVMVRRWLDHMDNWRKTEKPEGISAIILHRPRLPYGKSMFVFYHSDIGKIIRLFQVKENL